MAHDGSNNWNKLYIPGSETPRSLQRFVPHDEEAGATELKNTYPGTRARKKQRRFTGNELAAALLRGGR